MQENVFKYTDIASTNYGIVGLSERLALQSVAIVGLGGTGSYILDLVAKTWVKSIHLFDGDAIEHRNAFRSPGAISPETLRSKPNKAEHFCELYSAMRNNIFTHGHIDRSTIEELKNMSFVFLAAELGHLRNFVAEKLEEYEVPFIDVGMGITQGEDALQGVLRVTTSVKESRSFAKQKLPSPRSDTDNVYTKNVQVADLNALNAALAVIRWKKLYGFYDDYENEFNSRFLLNHNQILTQGCE